MLETIITTTTGESFTLLNTLKVIGTSVILGVLISLVYMKTSKKSSYNSGFSTTLIMLPVIISIIILLVGNNVARAFSLAGAFSIIRFRSAPGEPKDIAYVFFTLAIGLTCGMGYITYAVIFTVILSAVMILLDITKFTEAKNKPMQLKITVPEDLNYEGVFEEILDNYTASYYIEKVRTRDFGSLFELTYIIDLKSDVSQKSFIDELRCRNGNLNIALTLSSTSYGDK
ncbi:DUF4956 domain-containing protein [Terrisporobacter sp.]|uniref:DUF4956 domain-containing protein n=1 Tax=Terrisporobacter sp. TaxID=1965305 RepID=UPI002635DE93|nr:DUF4956 domain-containing protein [Terrisporobacter sp.]